MGVRTHNGGYGKTLKIPLTSKERRAWEESTSSSPSKTGVRRHLSPPPIKRPAEQFNSSGEKSPRQPSVAKLVSMIDDLRLENFRLSNRVSEAKVERDALRKDLDTLRDGLCAKIKRAFKTMGKPNLYYTK